MKRNQKRTFFFIASRLKRTKERVKEEQKNHVPKLLWQVVLQVF